MNEHVAVAEKNYVDPVRLADSHLRVQRVVLTVSLLKTLHLCPECKPNTLP